LIKRLTLILTFLICSSTVWCQVTVIGTVISSDDNTPLPGVNVVVKGTSTGTVTQGDGSFSLTVTDNNAVLIFSFVGYTLQEVPLNGRDNLKITLEVDCIRDWFDAQKIGLYANSGVVNSPIGGQFYFAFPAYFGKGTLMTGVSYQTDLDKNKFVNGQVELKHFIFNCDFDMDAGLFYRNAKYEDDFNSRAYSVEASSNFGRLRFITGYSNLNFNNIETNDKQNYAGPLIGIGTWIGGPLRLSIAGKAAIYKDHQEYFGQILRDSRHVDVFAKFYKLDSFTELSLGIGTTIGYKFKSQKR
jgi:hypothetical protein